MIRPARLAEIHAIVAAKSIEHPDLHRPLGLAGFRRVLARERIKLVLANHPRVAQLVASLNGWAIVIDRRQSPDARLICGCHELAHLWLHHDPFFARHETAIYDKSPPWYDAVREEEADAFAELLVRGPEIGTILPAKATRPPSARPRAGIINPGRGAQLEPSDPDGEAFLAMVRSAPRDPEPARTNDGRRVQFAIDRSVWQLVNLLDVWPVGGAVDYDNRIAGDNHELVTCSEQAAHAIVTQLARAGYKRTAVQIRRVMRQCRLQGSRQLTVSDTDR